MNGAYYSYFLEHHLRSAVRRKRPDLPIVLHDGVRSHITAPCGGEFTSQMELGLEHPTYFPDMNPCDFDLIAKIKLPLRGIRFRTRQAIIAAVE